MQILRPEAHETFDAKKPFSGLDVSLFFQKELRILVDQYGYSEEEYGAFLSWHQPRELVEKILDSTRFFRIIRDTDGKIVGFFESRNRGETETVQWIFIDESAQGQGLGTKLGEVFLLLQRKMSENRTELRKRRKYPLHQHAQEILIGDNFKRSRWNFDFRKKTGDNSGLNLFGDKVSEIE